MILGKNKIAELVTVPRNRRAMQGEYRPESFLQFSESCVLSNDLFVSTASEIVMFMQQVREMDPV
jgi:hypothetical protein